MKRIKEIFNLNDSPQKIALGLGLGVFAGILPGTGFLVALFLATFLRVNRASALLGCLATNTWLSFVILLPAIKIGSILFGMSWQQLRQDWVSILSGFTWSSLFKLSILQILLPIIAGYLLLALCLGLLVYLITILTLIVFNAQNPRN